MAQKDDPKTDKEPTQATPESEPKQSQPREEAQGGDKFAAASDKVVTAVKSGALRLFHFTGSATRLSKLKVEIHNLQSQVEELQLMVGKKLWEKYQKEKQPELKKDFESEFDRIDELLKQKAAKQKEADSITLVE